MIGFLVHRPIAVLVSFFALLLLGVAAFLKLPVSLLPEVDVPVILVRVDGDDLSAQEVEDRLAKPLRNSLLQMRGLKDLRSRASEGMGTIELLFDHGVDIATAFIEANEKVDMAMNSLPREVSRPMVVKSGIANIPAFRLNVYPKNKNATAADMIELGNFAREIVRRRIEQMPEVAMADITGFAMPRVEVIPKKGYLESIGLDDNTLLQAFRENSISLGTVLVKDGHYRYYLRFSGELQNLENLNGTPLNINGRLFRLADLAHIDYAAAETGFYQSGENTAVNFAVIKQASARMEDLKARFGDLVERMRLDYPEAVFEVTQDQTLLLDLSIGNLQQDLLLGGFLAFALMLAFIHKMRLAILIGITMPLSLMLSQLGFYLCGMSMNIISLGGLILGLSMIIDNSIVVIDTIAEHRARGSSVREAAIAGTNEIIRPLITSVLTNCAVFIPLIFLSGLAGAIFYDQALSIVIGVVSSLIVAILLLPPLYTIVHRNKPSKRRPSGFKSRFKIKPLINFTNLYDKGLKWSFRHPYLLTFIVILLTLAGGGLFPMLDKSRLPDITRNDFEVFIDWNEHLDTDRIKTRTTDIVRAFRQETETINIWSGPQQYLLPMMADLGHTQNRLYVKLYDPEKLERTKGLLQQYVQHRYPLATLTFHPAKNAFDEVFADRNAPLTVMVSDKKNRKMPRIAVLQALLDTIKKDLPDARANPIPLYDKIVLDVDQDVAMRYGISANRVGDAIANVLKERKISDFQSSAALVPLVLKSDRPESIRNMLNDNFVANADKEQVPLAALVKADRQTDYKYITAGSIGEYYPMDIFSENPESDLKKLGQTLGKFEDEIETAITGSFFDNRALVSDMVFILAISVLLLYFILAAQFESLIQPLFILVELPIAICGTVFLLYIGRSGLNIMSMIGIVVMSGLIINDSILKIDAINQLRRSGVPLMQAIFEGGHKRIRPIMMIALTSIGALAPTLFMTDLGSELQKPLTLALIGGMVIGLFVSLFFVPVVYWFIYRKKDEKAL